MIESAIQQDDLPARVPADLRKGLPGYAALLAARHMAHRAELRRLLEGLWAGQNLRLLDIACGDGFYTAAFASLLGRGSRIMAVDVLPAFLEWTLRQVKDAAGGGVEVSLMQADAERLPFPDACFDLVWCAQSLISLPDPLAALREMRRVIRPEGTVGILENDRQHEMQLPWPVELELAIDLAERHKELAEHDQASRNAGRRLSDLLAEAGLAATRRISLPIDRLAPLASADEEFLCRYLEARLERIAGRLDPGHERRLQRLISPDSPDYLPAQPSFWMTWTDIIMLATPK